MKKWLFLLLLAAAIGGGAYYWFSGSHVQPLTEKSLTFAEVRQGTIRDIVSATGLIEPREIVVVSSETAGTVVQLWGRIGDEVYEDAKLAQLDDRRIKLKLQEATNGMQLAHAAALQADAAWTQAKAAVSQALAAKTAAYRSHQIQIELKKNAPAFRSEEEQAKAQYDAASAGVEAAESGMRVAEAGRAVAAAKKQTAQTAYEEAEFVMRLGTIKVPGISTGQLKRKFLILERKVQEGQMVGPQSGPLFTLAGSLEVVDVHAQVAEGDINKIRKELTAVFNITGFNDEDVPFQGKVKEIRPLASNIKGAVYYDTVIEVENRKDKTTNEWQLRPGMTMSVDIIRREHPNVWKVPSGALNFTLDEAYQTEKIKAHVAAWKKRTDAKDWQLLWVWDDANQHPAPVFVRIGGTNKNGEPSLKDAEGNEILEWEPGKQPTQTLRVIIGAPPARAPGFFDGPANVKI
jgi:multidrug efflux pump subunit AcrA (membrane-fusion protein)